MKRAFLEDADGPAVAEAVRARLGARGALVTEHTRARVRFEGLAIEGRETFRRSGYVGIYQPFAEKEAELRVIAYAARPRQAFWAAVSLTFLAGLAAFVLLPSNDVWLTVTIAAYVGFFTTLLVYLGTWRASSELEMDLLDDFTAAARASNAASRALSASERTEAAFEETLEADVLAVRLRKAAKADAKAGVRHIPVKIPRESDASPPEIVPDPSQEDAGRGGFFGRFRRTRKGADPSPRRGFFARAPRAERVPKPGFVARIKGRLARRGAREVPVEDEVAKRARLEALRREVEAKKRGS